MFKNYLRIALANLLSNKVYTFINVIGLSIGMAASILIFLFVQDEISYDKFHEHGDRIFRTHFHWRVDEGTGKGGVTGAYRLAPTLESSFEAELDGIVRVGNTSTIKVSYEDQTFTEDAFPYIDENAFDVFSFNLLKGDPKTALTEPFTVVLTESTARKYFGDEDPIGKMLRVEDIFLVKVTGVMQDFPHNSHFIFDGFVSMKTGEKVFSERVRTQWGEGSVATYIRLKEGVNYKDIEKRLVDFVETHIEEGASKYFRITLMPLFDIHLHSDNSGEFEANGSINNVYIFSIVAFLIIVIACINYMNLATARSTERSREVGLRKVVGAHRSQVVVQFLGESLLIAGVAIVLSLLLAEIFLPTFNQVAGKSLTLHYLDNPMLILGAFILVVITGVLAGSYPALFLSRFQPVQVLKGGKGTTGGSNNWLRKGLVVMQFTMSIILMISTMIIYTQLKYLHNKDLGIDVAQVLSFPLGDSTMVRNFETIKTELLQNPNITHVTATNKRMTGRLSSYLGYTVDGAITDDDGDTRHSITTVTVDPDFFATFGAKIIEGRDFDKGNTADIHHAFIFNQAALKKMGLEGEVVGRSVSSVTFDIIKMDFVPKKGNVIGVVEDFHFESLYESIEPTAFQISTQWLNWVSVKVKPNDLPETIAHIKGIYDKHGKGIDFEYRFIDDYIQDLYKKEERFLSVFTSFSILAIIIACLGIFGLASFTAERRTKEIGVRKVLGSSITQITLLLTKDFIRLVGIAAILGSGLAWWLMSKWLEDFIYQIQMGVFPFVIAVVMALSIAVITVSTQAIRAARSNPIQALRYE